MYWSACLRLAVGLAIGFSTLSLPAASLWFGDRDGLHRIDTATNQVAATVPFEAATSIAVNAADGSVWALSQGRIARLGANGAVQFQVAVRDLGNGLGAPRLLALDPNDGSVWAGFENRLLGLDAAGGLRHSLDVSATDVAIAQDGSIWILAQSALQQRNATGALVRSIALDQRYKHLALDDAGGVLWLAGEKDLTRWSLAAPSQPALAILAPETISGISVDLQTGDVWAIGQNGLFAYSRDGQPRVSRDLRDFSIANPQEVLFDFSSQAAWVGHQQGLTRITAAGTVAAAFPAAPHVLSIAIGRSPVNIDPAVSIVAPQDGALLATATPELRVKYDALCGTTPCGFPNSYFSSFTLSALLNGTETGSSFVFDPATGGASLTPSTPLPEGLNTFSAQARDSFGRASATVSSSFTVDTIAPSFGNVTPASGSVLSEANIAIAGSVDDAAATVTLGSDTQGPSFTFPVTLVAGPNTYTLVARDAAGNSASLAVTYTYEPPNVPPSVAITAPANGAAFTAPASFTVAANAVDSDGSIVRVEFFSNGVLAGSDSDAPYGIDLAGLATGSYTLTARATDNRGGVTASAPVTVTVGPPNVLPVVTLAVAGGTPPVFAPATVALTATASDADGTIAKVEFLRNGNVEATVTTAPYTATLTGLAAGAHVLTARATDDRGGVTTSAAVTFTVTTPSITITSPFTNTLLAENAVIVRGRIVAPPNSGAGVQVNERTAALDAAGNFAVFVPLEPGSNAVQATLTLLDGTTVSHTITVSSQGAMLPFAVDATPLTGYAPLATSFTIHNPNNANVTFTFDGFGPFFLGAGATVQLNVTWSVGVHTPTIVFRAGTSAWAHRSVIDARDRAQTEQAIQAVWNGLNAALVAGDKARAMRYLTGGAQAKYGPLFDALMPHMPGIVASYSPLTQISLTPRIGEYAITRVDGGVQRIYMINFFRDAGGVWRVDGM